MCVVAGDLRATLALANILENSKTQFKVSTTHDGYIGPSYLGVEGFKYWLLPEKKF